jgi:DNA-binding MarR family transcriptional regulator
LSRQVLSDQVVRPARGVEAWVALLRAHAALTRALNTDLVSTHGLTLNDYEVLLHLARAEERQLRRVDLAQRLLLTASGITRLLDGLERAGYVCKGQCEADARVTYAVLTDAGLETLKAASATHSQGVQELFGDTYSDDELGALAELLGRLPAVGQPAGDCTVD